MFLEDGDWNSANEYCEKVLDVDPENPQAYLGKLMAELRVKNQKDLQDQAKPFDGNNNYQKAMRFGDAQFKADLVGYIEHINTRNENARLEGIYTRAQKAMSAATTESAYKEAARLFETISEYRDSAAQAEACYEKAEIARKKEEADRLERARIAKKRKKIGIIAASVVCAIIALIILLNTVILPMINYNDAVTLMDAGKLKEAAIAFGQAGDYQDARERSFALWDQVANRDTISVGGKHTVGLKADGTVVAVRDNRYGRCAVSGWKDIVAIIAGGNHTVGLKADGTVVDVG